MAYKTISLSKDQNQIVEKQNQIYIAQDSPSLNINFFTKKNNTFKNIEITNNGGNLTNLQVTNYVLATFFYKNKVKILAIPNFYSTLEQSPIGKILYELTQNKDTSMLLTDNTYMINNNPQNNCFVDISVYVNITYKNFLNQKFDKTYKITGIGSKELVPTNDGNEIYTPEQVQGAYLSSIANNTTIYITKNYTETFKKIFEQLSGEKFTSFTPQYTELNPNGTLKTVHKI